MPTETPRKYRVEIPASVIAWRDHPDRVRDFALELAREGIQRDVGYDPAWIEEDANFAPHVSPMEFGDGVMVCLQYLFR